MTKRDRDRDTETDKNRDIEIQRLRETERQRQRNRQRRQEESEPLSSLSGSPPEPILLSSPWALSLRFSRPLEGPDKELPICPLRLASGEDNVCFLSQSFFPKT